MVFALIALLTVLTPLSSLNAAEKISVKDARRKAEEIQSKLENAASEIESVSKTEAQILFQLNSTDFQLDQIRKQIAITQNDLVKHSEKIDKMHAAQKESVKRIAKREIYISKRLTALYKLGRLGQLPVLATADSGADFVRRKQSIAFILEHDRLELDRLRQDRKMLDQVLVELAGQRSAKKALERQLQLKNKTLLANFTQKSDLLTQIRTQKRLQLAAVDALKKSVERLNRTIKDLAAEPSGSTDDSGHPDVDFSKFKGLLNLPVKGKIIYFYGRYKNKAFNVDNFRSGITIKAERGEPIRSVGKGITIYADWFKGYGNMIIIDHGRHYYTVYAHLEEKFKFKGDRVEADEVIATVGDTGSLNGAVLHFEVRHHGTPLDPMEWIRNG